MIRALSADGATALKQWEGLELAEYPDSAGVPTIGYGHTKGVTVGMICTQAQADAWFLEDTAWACDCVDSSVKVSLNDNQFAALVSFCFNVGTDAFKTSTLLRQLNTGDYASVPSEMAKWVYVTANGKKTKSTGLENRRNAEGGLWVKGSYVPSARVSPDPPVSPWKTLHVKMKTAGSAIAATGMTGASLSDAGHKLTDLSTQGWHVLGYAGIALVGAGILWGVFRSDT